MVYCSHLQLAAPTGRLSPFPPRRWCPSASHHLVSFLFLLALSFPLYFPFHSFPFLSLGRGCLPREGVRLGGWKGMGIGPLGPCNVGRHSRNRLTYLHLFYVQVRVPMAGAGSCACAHCPRDVLCQIWSPIVFGFQAHESFCCEATQRTWGAAGDIGRGPRHRAIQKSESVNGKDDRAPCHMRERALDWCREMERVVEEGWG